MLSPVTTKEGLSEGSEFFGVFGVIRIIRIIRIIRVIGVIRIIGKLRVLRLLRKTLITPKNEKAPVAQNCIIMQGESSAFAPRKWAFSGKGEGKCGRQAALTADENPDKQRAAGLLRGLGDR